MTASLRWTLCLTAFAHGAAVAGVCQNAVEYTDSIYGGSIRQLLKSDGHEHNLYYYRDPWNSDLSYMAGVQSDLLQQNWKVVLYDGAGCFIKDLFPITQYDWRVAWDRNDPEILYTVSGNRLYRYSVTTGAAALLKSFAPLGLKPAGLSLNQEGDRVLVVTSDTVFHSFHLPDMDDERTFEATFPEGCTSAWDKERYIAFRNYVVTGCSSGDPANQATLIYDDDGQLLHQFDGLGGGGHHDFSPDGKWAYFKLWTRTDPLEIHVVNIDGSDDRVVLSVPSSDTRYLQNLHLSWPRKVNDWFLASFFPNAARLPDKYAPYLDEIMQIRMDGATQVLARSETAYSAPTPQSGGPQDMFWAQPLARPSADGRRINFNSNRSGTIDQCILFVDEVPKPDR